MNDNGPIEPSGDRGDPSGIGDDHLLDAILRGRAEDTPELMERRVTAVMDRVATTPRETTPAAPGGFRFSPIPFARTIAATILFAGLISLLLVVTRPRPAEATLLEQAIERMEVEDLTYAISVVTAPGELTDPDPGAPRETGRRPMDERTRSTSWRHPGSRAFAWKRDNGEHKQRGGERRMLFKLDGATLHTRGDRWTLLVPHRNDEVFVRGFDGEKAWTNHQPDRRPQRHPAGEVDRRGKLPFLFQFAMLDLPELISRIGSHYEVSQPERIPSENGQSSLVRYEAKRMKPFGAQRPLPSSVEIWADPESARIVFLRVSGLTIEPDGTTAEIEIALDSTTKLEDDVFSPDGYPIIERRSRPPNPSTDDGEVGGSGRGHRPGHQFNRGDRSLGREP